jgi:hypothetical protein
MDRDSVTKKPKIIPISHLPMADDEPDLLLLPLGEYYNGALNTAVPGDILKFWNNECHRILMIAKVPLQTNIAGFLAKYIYDTSVKIMQQHWIAEALRNGCTKRAIRDDYCIIVKYDKQKYYSRNSEH